MAEHVLLVWFVVAVRRSSNLLHVPDSLCKEISQTGTGYGVRDAQSTLGGRKCLRLCIEGNLNQISRNYHHRDIL